LVNLRRLTPCFYQTSKLSPASSDRESGLIKEVASRKEDSFIFSSQEAWYALFFVTARKKKKSLDVRDAQVWKESLYFSFALSLSLSLSLSQLYISSSFFPGLFHWETVLSILSPCAPFNRAPCTYLVNEQSGAFQLQGFACFSVAFQVEPTWAASLYLIHFIANSNAFD